MRLKDLQIDSIDGLIKHATVSRASYPPDDEALLRNMKQLRFAPL